MLILVGVTITVILNGGLFKTSQKASAETQIEADREILQEAVWGTIGEDGAMHLENLKLPSGFTENNGIYTKKENKFKITEDGIVKPVIARNSTELERYIFGEDGLGRDLVADQIFDLTSSTFIDNTIDIKFLYNSTILETSDLTLYNFYVEYKNKIYKFQLSCNRIGYGYESKFEYISDPTDGINPLKGVEEGTKVGKYVRYDNKDWIVLYDDATNGLQMISKDILEEGKVCIGSGDETAQTPGDIDKNGEANTDLDKTIYSYNNAIERLNKKCESLVTPKEGIILGVRSVGSNPINPNDDKNTPKYESENLKTSNPLYNGLGKDMDLNFIKDYDRMVALGISKANNESRQDSSYWLASRAIGVFSDGAYFDMRILSEDGSAFVLVSGLWFAGYSGSVSSGYNFGSGVRPVITLKSEALNGLAGEGTADNPLILQ